MKHRNSFSLQEALDLLRHFSNQNEGNEDLYDQFEKLFVSQLETMSDSQLVVDFFEPSRMFSKLFSMFEEEETSLSQGSLFFLSRR